MISAPSGAGKTTICARLLRDYPQIRLSISSTTRAPRGTEQNGKEYFFLSIPEFEKQIQRDRFAEWAKVHGNYYGTSRDVVEEAFQKSHPLLLDIDVQGSASLRKAYPDETALIFIAPPSLEALEQRLRSRGTDSEETIARRMSGARAEMARQNEFDKIIVNDDLDRAYNELKRWLKEEHEI